MMLISLMVLKFESTVKSIKFDDAIILKTIETRNVTVLVMK